LAHFDTLTVQYELWQTDFSMARSTKTSIQRHNFIQAMHSRKAALCSTETAPIRIKGLAKLIACSLIDMLLIANPKTPFKKFHGCWVCARMGFFMDP